METQTDQTPTQGDQGSADIKRTPKRAKPGFMDFLAGESKSFPKQLKPFLPHDLIGGAIPYVAGTEDEAVWNAASQACGTEKVHYSYVVEDKHVWYLACPSSSLASHPDSWCPLAAALPGNSEYWDKETVYLYEQEGQASALRWDSETSRMQVFLGAARTILPRVQSMDANFVTINPDVADVVSWKNKMLRTEKASRAFVRVLFLSGLLVNVIAAAVLLFNLARIGAVGADLQEVKQKTDEAALMLVENATNVMQSDTIKHMVRVQSLLDSLSLTNGYLVRYEVSGTRTEWDAIVPQGLANKAIEATKHTEVVNGRIRQFAPKVSGAEEGDNVRIKGNK